MIFIKPFLLSLCLVGTLLGEEVEYVKCDGAEIALEQARGNNCVPLTVHRILRDIGKSRSYETIFKELGTDAEGTIIDKSLTYLRTYCDLTAMYIRDDDYTKTFISDKSIDFTFKLESKPHRYKFLWVGMYNGGCHMAICYLTTKPLSNHSIEVEYRLSHSGRINECRIENILTPEEFFSQTMGLWEIK
jgi:hypothetical protein